MYMYIWCACVYTCICMYMHVLRMYICLFTYSLISFLSLLYLYYARAPPTTSDAVNWHYWVDQIHHFMLRPWILLVVKPVSPVLMSLLSWGICFI